MQLKCKQIGPQKISYYESDGKGSPIVFVHGNSSSALTFSRQFNSPLGERYRLIALDLPGHGKSDHSSSPDETYTLPGYANIITEFARKTSVEDAIFIGWSLGGHILMEAAALLQKAKGFIIFGAPPAAIPLAITDAFLPNPSLPGLFKGNLNENEIEALVSCYFNMNQTSIIELFKEDIKNTDKLAREAIGRSIGECNYRDEVNIVNNIKTPLAIIHGKDDQFVNLDYLKNLDIPSLWRNEIQTIHDSGHAPHIEQAENFNILLEEFIQDTF